MQDAKARLEKLRADAADCDIIAKLATNKAKREAFRELSESYQRMADELEALIASGNFPGELGI